MSKTRLYAVVSVLVLTGCGKPPDDGTRAQQPNLRPPARFGEMVVLGESSPQLSRIKVAVAEAADVPHEQVIAPGKVEVNPGRVYRLALPVAGRVRDVHVTLGDQLRQGQPVITFESAEVSAIQSAIRQADANVSQARAALAKAEADLDRARDLLANRAIAQKEVLAAETTVPKRRPR